MWRSLIIILIVQATVYATEPDPQAVAEEWKQLQGLWSMTKYVTKGKDRLEEKVKLLIRERDCFIAAQGDEPSRITLVLDITRTPKQFDAKFGREPDFIPGIYRIEGKTLTMRFPDALDDDEKPAKLERPKNFTDKNMTIMEFTRLQDHGELRDLSSSCKAVLEWQHQVPNKDIPAKLPVTGAIANSWDHATTESFYLTTQKELDDLWKVLQATTKTPTVDFDSYAVVVAKDALRFKITEQKDGRLVVNYALMARPRIDKEGKKLPASETTIFTVAVFPRDKVNEVLKSKPKAK